MSAKGDISREKIMRCILVRSVPPTIREIADSVGLSVNAVATHLKVLLDSGQLTRQMGKSRSLVPRGYQLKWVKDG